VSKLYDLNDLENFFVKDLKDNIKVDFPNESGSVEVEKTIISDDIFLYKNSFNFKDDVSLESSSSEEGLCINIVLDGSLKYTDKILDEQTNKCANSMFVKYINQSQSLFEVNKDSILKDIGIIIKGDFLQEFFLEKISNKELVLKNYEKNISTNFKTAQTNLKTKILAHEIFNSPYEGELHKIYLQSKVYEIVFHELSDILQVNRLKNIKKEVKLTKEDIYALQKAKSLICEKRFFLNLPKLSKEVALNEFKLKYGFKKLFNTTPGALILEFRMLEARKLLESSELNITEISKLVGYKYVQSFTTAFKKRFNVNPKEFIKSRKYYY